MICCVACIFLGGVIFQATEKQDQQWTFIDAIYFSFVTVSTLGFGDLVPAIDLKSSTGISKLVTVLAFITVGNVLTVYVALKTWLFVATELIIISLFSQ